MLLLTLRGTPTMYYGDEIGMMQVSIPAERVSDPLERNMPGFGLGRDGARTPMQWTAACSAASPATNLGCPSLGVSHPKRGQSGAVPGFGAQPLPASDRIAAKDAALVVGSYRRIATEGEVLVFVRQLGEESVLVALNFGSGAATVNVGRKAGLVGSCCRPVAAGEGEPVGGSLQLNGNEGWVIAPETDWEG